LKVLQKLGAIKKAEHRRRQARRHDEHPRRAPLKARAAAVEQRAAHRGPLVVAGEPTAAVSRALYQSHEVPTI